MCHYIIFIGWLVVLLCKHEEKALYLFNLTEAHMYVRIRDTSELCLVYWGTVVRDSCSSDITQW